jgi:hypothetical protein
MKLSEFLSEPRNYNGGEMIGRWLVCSKCDDSEEFYSDSTRLESFVKEAKKAGWKIVNGKPICGDCNKESI